MSNSKNKTNILIVDDHQLVIDGLKSMLATEKKYEAVWLGVWEHNIRAQKFYGKYGFEDSGYTHDFPIGSTPQTDKWFWKFLKQ